MGLIEQAKAAYVAGRIAVDELEALVEHALDLEDGPLLSLPAWTSVATLPAATLQAEWERAYTGPRSAHRTMVLPAGATYTRIGELTDAPGGVIVLH